MVKHEALVILMEECAEVIKACSKIIIFGEMNFHPSKPQANHNIRDLELELGDVIAMIQVLQNAGYGINADRIHASYVEKMEKLKRHSKLPHDWLKV